MAVKTARSSLDRWEAWLDQLDQTPLDFFEYEALLLHREVLDQELEIAGIESLHDRADELDARFQDHTEVDVTSPFAPGSGRGSIRDALRRGWWWSRLPVDADARAYTLAK